MPAVGGPFPYASVHVIEAVRIRRKRTCGFGAFLVPRLAAVLAIGVALAHLIAPPVRARRAAAHRVFPLGLSGQTVRFARRSREPLHVLLRVVPTHVARGS